MGLPSAGAAGAVLVLFVAGCGPPPPPSSAPARTQPRDEAPASQLGPASASAPASGPAGPHRGPPPAPVRLFTTTVTRVVDGDTVVLDGGERVRVANINAPEIDEPLGLESRAAAIELVLEKRVRIAAGARDRYGRLVGDVLLPDSSLGEELVRQGLAHVYLIPPVDGARAHSLLALEAEARKLRRGIWATSRYRGAFHLTSFHANPRGDDRADLNAEYVRLANVSGGPQSLKGYTLTNRKGQRFRFRAVTVPAGYTVIVHSGAGDSQLDPARQLELYWNRRYPAWSNTGDSATLVGPDGQTVDEATYDPHQKKVYPK